VKHRQNEVKKKHNGLLIFVVVILLGVALFLTSGLFFQIKTIRVEGISACSKSEVLELAGFSAGDNILIINKANSARQITEKLPYAQSVVITREMPDTVVITVTETQAAAAIENRGAYWLFDTEGVLLETVHIPPKLPIVTGTELITPFPGDKINLSEPEKSIYLLSLLEEMQKLGILEDVSEIDIQELADVIFLYRSQYIVALGVPEGLEKKLRVMEKALQEMDYTGPGMFDLSTVLDNDIARFFKEE